MSTLLTQEPSTTRISALGTAIDTRTWSTPEVADMTGLSTRQIDYVIRSGRYRPAVAARGSGTRRRFNERDVLVLRAWALVSTALRGGTGGRGDGVTLEWVERIAALPDALLLDEVGTGDGRVTVIIDLDPAPGEHPEVLAIAARWMDG